MFSYTHTLDAHCRHLAQVSFRDLFAKGTSRASRRPPCGDVDFQTAVAQAKVKDRPTHGAFHHLAFGVGGSNGGFVIATTRPGLRPACVGSRSALCPLSPRSSSRSANGPRLWRARQVG